MTRFLVTGAAGFIGHWLVQRLLQERARVVGVDNLNSAYDPRIKRWRLARLATSSRFQFHATDVTDSRALREVFAGRKYDAVFHLAARAGAPQSVREPGRYVVANAMGTQRVMEACSAHGVPKLVLASTSSVYGKAGSLPIAEDAPADRPLSPYAASKRAAEVLAHAHHHLHGLDITVLRYFTVYGPAGRPDMSLFRFIRWIREGEPIVLRGDGHQSRDFTYVADIVEGTLAAAVPLGCEIVNLGSDSPVRLCEALRLIETCLGREARVERAKVPRVDVRATWADTRKARRLLGWRPETSLTQGIERTVRWYEENRSWARDLILPE